MFGWSKKNKEPKPPVVHDVEVGKVKFVFKLEDGSEVTQYEYGYAFWFDWSFGSGDVVSHKAERVAEDYLEACQKWGAFRLDGNRFIPHCKVKEFSATIEPHTVQVEEK